MWFEGTLFGCKNTLNIYVNMHNTHTHKPKTAHILLYVFIYLPFTVLAREYFVREWTVLKYVTKLSIWVSVKCF